MIRTVLSAAIVLAGLATAGQAADIQAYTEEWPPYNFDEDSEVRGIATDILRAACQEAQLDCAIQLVPWARAYALAASQPDTLVYTTARKPEREHLFRWVGPILPRATWVYARNGLENLPASRADLRRFRIGVVQGEASVTELRAAAVPASQILPDKSNAAVLKQLNAGFVDLMIDTEVGMAWNLKSAELDEAAVRKLFKLTDEGGYYFALNPRTDPAKLDKLQTAVDSLRRDGRLQALIRRY